MAKKTVQTPDVATTDAAQPTLIPAPPVAPPEAQEREPQKTASVTLTGADGSSLYLLAERKPDGAVTTVNTITPGIKGMSRGMTERHASFEDAKSIWASWRSRLSRKDGSERLHTKASPPSQMRLASSRRHPRARSNCIHGLDGNVEAVSTYERRL
jgi:hypothetical protein